MSTSEERLERAQLDAEDLESAIEERQNVESDYERYDGPLGWSAWLEQRETSAQLAGLGIASPELPEKAAAALGPDRAERVVGQVERKLVDFARSPPSREDLSAQARQFGATTRALDSEPPDRWLREHGDRYAAAIAARHQLRRERELAPAEPEQTVDAAAPDKEASDVGMDPF